MTARRFSLMGLLALLASVICLGFAPEGVAGQPQTSMSVATEVYQNCDATQRAAIACGMHANCVVIDGQPGCACIVDQMTGLGLVGNPYDTGCTYDISGVWQAFYAIDRWTGYNAPIIAPASNEPFIIRLDRTESLLKTKYIHGAIFTVTALSAFAVGVCAKFVLSIEDNKSVIMENAQGYAGNNGRSILLRTPRMDTSLIKERTSTFLNRVDLSGFWRKEDGSGVLVQAATPPLDISAFFTLTQAPYYGYSYQDESWGSEVLTKTMGIWMDNMKTDQSSAVGIAVNAKFVQTGFFGTLRFGSRRIDVFSSLNGQNTLAFFQMDPAALPESMISGAGLLSTARFPSQQYGIIGSTSDSAVITGDYTMAAQSVNVDYKPGDKLSVEGSESLEDASFFAPTTTTVLTRGDESDSESAQNSGSSDSSSGSAGASSSGFNWNF